MSGKGMSENAAPRHRLLPYIMLGVLGPLSLIIVLWPFIWWFTHLPAGNHIPPWRICDFPMFFTAGHLATSTTPSDVYIQHVMLTWEYHHSLRSVLPNPFVYPPPTLLLVRFVNLSSYWFSYLCWTTLLSILSVIVLRAAQLSWIVIAFILLSPAALINTMLGQISTLTSCCFAASLLLADTAPVRSGIFSALTLFKPQMALLAPLAILARRRWRAILSGLVTISLLCLLTTLIFGMDLWQGYFNHGLPASHKLLNLPYPRPGFSLHYRGRYEYGQTSVFFMLRSFGLSPVFAMIGQILSAIFASVACWQLWQRNDVDLTVRVSLTIFLSLLVTPYAFTEDMTAYSIGIILLVKYRSRLDFYDVVLLIWPALAGVTSFLLDRSITPLIVIWASYRAYRAFQSTPKNASLTTEFA